MVCPDLGMSSRLIGNLMNKYKIKPYDEANDIYMLYRHKFLFFWTCIGTGSKEKLTQWILDEIKKEKVGKP